MFLDSAGEVAIEGISSAKGNVELTVHGRLGANGGYSVSGNLVSLKADSFHVESVIASTMCSIEKTGPGVLGANFGFVGFNEILSPKIVLTGNDGIGTAAIPFPTYSEKQEIQAFSSAGDIYIKGYDPTDLTVSGLSGKSISIENIGNVTLKNNTVANVGSLDVHTTGGTVKLGGNVSAATGINIVNSGTDKSKIVIDPLSTIATTAKSAGQGNIVISLGPNGSTSPDIPENVLVTGSGGTVTFTGSAGAIKGGLLSAKSPPTTLEVQGANILINNGSAKAGNVAFGSSVHVTADPQQTEAEDTDESDTI